MAKYTGPDCRMCRREGAKLFLKGEKCVSEKCAFIKRAGKIPGAKATPSRKKTSEYASQLREKQKCKRTYGILEKQFRMYYDKADRMRGITGENMLALLERRLDNVIYRLGIGDSRAQARQIVNHGHITVDGKKVNIPSYLVKVGQVISVRESSKDSDLFADIKATGASVAPKWLEMSNSTLTGKVLELPTREDVDSSIKEHMIVELYSK